MKLAIYAITETGTRQAVRLARALPFAQRFISSAGLNGLSAETLDVDLLELPMSGFVAERFFDYDGHIFICATGIVTRVIAPLLKDKRTDPAVVCMDEQANFVIPLLSGHRGGANALAERVAHICKGQAVITTASDVSQSVSVDMLGSPFGWTLDPATEASITPVSAAVVNNKPVIIVQQAGEPNWWKYEKKMPRNLICHDQFDEVDANDYNGAIWITDQQVSYGSEWNKKLVLWRPKSLVLGIGCDRNTPLAVLKAGLEQFSELHGLSLQSVSAIASIDLKADEAGLNQLSEEYQWPFVTFDPSLLDNLPGVENPSDYVK